MKNALIKCKDGVYRQVATRLHVAANDNTLTEPLCRQTYELERAMEAWRAGEAHASA